MSLVTYKKTLLNDQSDGTLIFDLPPVGTYHVPRTVFRPRFSYNRLFYTPRFIPKSFEGSKPTVEGLQTIQTPGEH